MAQHVTYYKMRVQPGKMSELRTLMENWERERGRPLGFTASVTGSRKDNPDEVWGAVLWDNTENYMKNANSPEQNTWYEQMRALLAADPEWFDCDVIQERMP